MKKFFLIVAILCVKLIAAQNTNNYDMAPASIVTTNGTEWAGGATGRSSVSSTSLSVGQYIVLDLRAAVSIAKISFGTYWAADGRFIPAGYTIGYSADGINFTNIITETTNTNLNPVYANLNTPQNRYWKFTVTATQPGQTYSSIANLQLQTNGVGAATSNQYWNSGGFSSSAINFMGGEVGIGTFIPETALHISGSGPNFGQLIENRGTGNEHIARLTFKSASGSDTRSGSIDWFDGSTFRGRLGLLRNGGIRIHNDNDQPIFFMNNAGDVGLGTVNPQGKLAVNGDIYAKKVKVTITGWSDYVFASAYKLPSLADVKAFIQLHGHLPDVPSAQEVEKNGINLGDNQALLLKKIEELTLYAIEQNERIADQQRQINELQQQMKNRGKQR